MLNELNGWNSDRWRTRSDNVVSAKSKGNEEKGVGFYRWNARKTKRHFDLRYKPIDERHVSYALNASGSLSEFCKPDDLILPEPSSHKPCHRPLEISTITPLIMSPSTQHFQPSSKLNLSPFMSVSRPSTHEHRTISMYLYDCHPNWPLFVDNDGPNGVKGAAEEDKNRK